MNIKKVKLFIYISVILSLIFSFSVINTYSHENDKPWFGIKEGYSWYVVDNIGYINISAQIGISIYNEILSAFNYFEHNNINTVKIIINSYGGDLYTSIAIAQYMLSNNNKYRIETYGMGFVASGATLVLMSGTPGYRYIYENTIIMIHQLATYDPASFKNEMQRRKDTKRVEFLQNNFENFYLKILNLSKEKLKNMLEEETWFLPKRALEINLIDTIIK